MQVLQDLKFHTWEKISENLKPLNFFKALLMCEFNDRKSLTWGDFNR